MDSFEETIFGAVKWVALAALMTLPMMILWSAIANMKPEDLPKSTAVEVVAVDPLVIISVFGGIVIAAIVGLVLWRWLSKRAEVAASIAEAAKANRFKLLGCSQEQVTRVGWYRIDGVLMISLYGDDGKLLVAHDAERLREDTEAFREMAKAGVKMSIDPTTLTPAAFTEPEMLDPMEPIGTGIQMYPLVASLATAPAPAAAAVKNKAPFWKRLLGVITK